MGILCSLPGFLQKAGSYSTSTEPLKNLHANLVMGQLMGSMRFYLPTVYQVVASMSPGWWSKQFVVSCVSQYLKLRRANGTRVKDTFTHLSFIAPWVVTTSCVFLPKFDQGTACANSFALKQEDNELIIAPVFHSNRINNN